MRPFLSLAAGVLVLAIGGLAVAPTPGTAAYIQIKKKLAQAAPPTAPAEQPAISSRRTVNLTEEDRHTIREIVLKDLNVSKAPAGVKVAIGDVTPQDVVTHEFPAVMANKISALQSLKYFVKSDDEIVIIDKGGKVADIVK